TGPLDRGVGEDAGRLLEGGRRQPGLGRQRRLGDTHQHRTAGRRVAALGHHATVLRLEHRPLDRRTGQELGGARVDDDDPAQHLPDDHLDVLVVDAHTLGAVHLLHLANQVQLGFPRTHHAQHLVRVDRTFQQLLADVDVVAVLQLAFGAVHVDHREALALRQLVVDDLVAAVVRDDGDLPVPVVVLQADAARSIGDRGLALRDAGLEQLLHTRQTGGDVVTGHTTLVERAHRQLRTGLTDRLRGDDADGLADVHQLAGGHRAAVADRAHPGAGLAGEHAADLDRGDAGLDQLLDDRVAEVGALGDQDVAVAVGDVLGSGARVDAGLHVRVPRQRTVGQLLGDRHPDAALGAAVGLADDDVLRDVDQTPGQVTGVGGAERRVGQTLAGTVVGDEVLQHRQAFAEVRLDRARDVLTLRVGHQTAHTRQLDDLGHVTGGTG